MHQAEFVDEDRMSPSVGRLEPPGDSDMFPAESIHVNLVNHKPSLPRQSTNPVVHYYMLSMPRKYEAAYFGLERLETSEIVESTGCQKPCQYRQIRNLKSNKADSKIPSNPRELRRVGEPTRIFQFEKNQKGVKLWVVSREKATEVWRKQKVDLIFQVLIYGLTSLVADFGGTLGLFLGSLTKYQR